MDVLVDDKAIIPQIEAFAKTNQVDLPNGWKVDLSKHVKQQLSKAKLASVDEKYVAMWNALFEKLN